MASNLNHKVLSFLFPEKIVIKLESKNINITVSQYKMKKIYRIYLSENEFKYHRWLLFLENEDNFQFVYIKYFNRLMYNKTEYYLAIQNTNSKLRGFLKYEWYAKYSDAWRR